MQDMCTTFLPGFYLFCGLLITTLSGSRRVEAGWMAGVETLVAAALLWKVYQVREVRAPGGTGRWTVAMDWWIALLWFCALACSRQFASMLLLLVLSAYLTGTLNWQRGVQAVVLLLALALLLGLADLQTPHSLWHSWWTLQINPYGICCDQYQRYLADLALAKAADWGPALGLVRPVPQSHGDFALVWLVVRVGWVPVAGLVAGLVGLWTAGLVGALRQCRHTPRDGAGYGLTRVWLVTGLWLLVQAVLALAVNLALLGQPVGMGFPGLSWHPVSLMMVLVWCGCAWHFASSDRNRPGAIAA